MFSEISQAFSKNNIFKIKKGSDLSSLFCFYFFSQGKLTALHLAVKNGAERIMKSLFDNGVDVNATSQVRFLVFCI